MGRLVISLLSLERDLLWLREKLLLSGHLWRGRGSYDNHLEGADPEREVGHDFDVFSPRSTVPLVHGSHTMLFIQVLDGIVCIPGSPHSTKAKPGGVLAALGSDLQWPKARFISVLLQHFQDSLHSPSSAMDRNPDASRDLRLEMWRLHSTCSTGLPAPLRPGCHGFSPTRRP